MLDFHSKSDIIQVTKGDTYMVTSNTKKMMKEARKELKKIASKPEYKDVASKEVILDTIYDEFLLYVGNKYHMYN
jgi:hypothetical protein|tara:strand:+ start:131 stop:355 length:225 start_codon:yes stop_codon:yes gene_type:complete